MSDNESMTVDITVTVAQGDHVGVGVKTQNADPLYLDQFRRGETDTPTGLQLMLDDALKQALGQIENSKHTPFWVLEYTLYEWGAGIVGSGTFEVQAPDLAKARRLAFKALNPAGIMELAWVSEHGPYHK